MWNRTCQVILHVLSILIHTVVIALALSIPIVLAVQTVYVDGQLTLRAWFEAGGDLSRWTWLLINTLQVAGLGTAIAVIGGSALACLAFKTRWPGRGVMIFLLLFLMCLPVYVVSTAIFAVLGLEASFESTATAGLVHGLVSIPLAAILIGLGLLFVDSELEEAALLDNSGWAVIRRVSLPRSGWTIAVTTLIVFLLIVTDYSITDILQVRTFSEEVFTQYQLKGERVAPFLLSLPVMILLAVAFIVLDRHARYFATPLFQGQPRKPLIVSLGQPGRMLAWSVLLILAACVGWAFVSVVEQIDSWQRFSSTIRSVWPEWRVTLLVALTTGIGVSLLSVSLAWMLAKSKWWRQVTGVMLLGLMATPAPTLAMTLIWYFNRSTPKWLMDVIWPVYDSIWMYDLTIGLRLLPIAVLIVLPAVRRVPAAVDETARCEGADWLSLVMRVYWPQCRGNALCAGVVVMVLTVGELNCSYLVAPPGQLTLSAWFFTWIHFGLTAEVATACLAATVTTLLPSVLLFLLLKKKLYP